MPDLTWDMLLDRWDLIESDLHHIYGIDLGDVGHSSPARSWRWLKLRVVGLLGYDSRLAAALRPADGTRTSAATSSPAATARAYDDPRD